MTVVRRALPDLRTIFQYFFGAAHSAVGELSSFHIENTAIQSSFDSERRMDAPSVNTLCIGWNVCALSSHATHVRIQTLAPLPLCVVAINIHICQIHNILFLHRQMWNTGYIYSNAPRCILNCHNMAISAIYG